MFGFLRAQIACRGGYRDVCSAGQLERATLRASDGQPQAMNENFSLIVMCLFLLASLAFLAQQLTSYH